MSNTERLNTRPDSSTTSNWQQTERPLASEEAAARRYLHVHQGFGGIYPIPTKYSNTRGEVEDIWAIGTTGCLTCVGVFFPVDEERYFFAHVDGHIYNDAAAASNEELNIPHDESAIDSTTAEESETGEDVNLGNASSENVGKEANELKATRPAKSDSCSDLSDREIQKILTSSQTSSNSSSASSTCEPEYKCTPQQGHFLYNKVSERLKAHFPSFADGRYPEEYKRRVMLLCPRLTVHGKRIVGWYIANAFHKFLNLPNTVDDMVTRDKHGFLMDFRKDESDAVQMVGWLDRESDLERAPVGRDWNDDFHDHFDQDELHGWEACNPRSWTLHVEGTWCWSDQYEE